MGRRLAVKAVVWKIIRKFLLGCWVPFKGSLDQLTTSGIWFIDVKIGGVRSAGGAKPHPEKPIVKVIILERSCRNQRGDYDHTIDDFVVGVVG